MLTWMIRMHSNSVLPDTVRAWLSSEMRIELLEVRHDAMLSRKVIGEGPEERDETWTFAGYRGKERKKMDY